MLAGEMKGLEGFRELSRVVREGWEGLGSARGWYERAGKIRERSEVVREGWGSLVFRDRSRLR